jgi:hypothetical protein
LRLGIFKAMPDVRREPFFRFSLMVARAAKDDVQLRRATTWSALDGETLISLSAAHPHQQLIDRHLAKGGVRVKIGSTVNHMISPRGKELPPGVDEFTSFLKNYIATWAGRADVL